MRPKDLSAPFTWDQRRPLLDKNILYVPEFCEENKHFTCPDFFPNSYPIHIEYCSGNGEWITSQALKHPNINWIAVEKQFPRARKIKAKQHNMNLSNLLIVCGLAQDFTQYFLMPNTISWFYINFPDPWPKNRHAKHRLIQPSFIEQITAAAAPKACCQFVSDDAKYAQHMQNMMSAHPRWSAKLSTLTQSHGPSFFDRLWRSKNRTIYQILSQYD